MKSLQKSGSQRGIALLTVLLFLLVISALAVGMMYVSTTDTQINSNFRSEQNAYFSARAGLEEMRDRMRTASANYFGSLPTGQPGTGAGNVIYLINQGNDSTTVQPWNPANKYFDTELCHEGFTTLYSSTLPADQACTVAASGGSGWYTSVATSLPLFSSTGAAIPYKWARLTLKQNYSVQGHPVNSSYTSTNLVCYNANYEQVLTATTQSSANCATQWETSAPVYMITALAVTKDGARKMVQGEVTQVPGMGFNYAIFADATGCSAVSFGGNITTDSYNSGTHSNPTGSQLLNTGGDVGANGNINGNGGSASIGGNVDSVNYTNTTPGSCGSGSTPIYTGKANDIQTGNKIQQISTVATPTPSIPVGPDGGSNVSSGKSLSPGTYGDISINGGTLTLTAGTYYVNSITVNGNANVVVSSGPVIIEVEGDGATSSGPAIDLGGGATVNGTASVGGGLPANLQLYYAGSNQTVEIRGNASPRLAVYAPNAQVTLHGGGNNSVYGAVVGKNVLSTGNITVNYDAALKNATPQYSYYTLLGFRELYY